MHSHFDENGQREEEVEKKVWEYMLLTFSLSYKNVSSACQGTSKTYTPRQ